MKKVPVPVARANRLINYGPVVLVSSHLKGKDNIVTIAWNTPLSHSPMLVGVSISHENYSNQMIKEAKEFVINIPGANLTQKVLDCGSVSGEEVDKFKKFKLTKVPGAKVKAPLIDECLGHLECKVKEMIEVGDHTFFIGEVVAASCVEGFLTKDYTADIKKFKTLHHLGGERFGSLGVIL